jgi:hypothetical protein
MRLFNQLNVKRRRNGMDNVLEPGWLARLRRQHISSKALDEEPPPIRHDVTVKSPRKNNKPYGSACNWQIRPMPQILAGQPLLFRSAARTDLCSVLGSNPDQHRSVIINNIGGGKTARNERRRSQS